MFMRRWVILLVLAVYPVILNASDPLSVIQFPLINRPALVLPGQSFTVRCKAGQSVHDWQATLTMPYTLLNLTLTEGGYTSGIRTLLVTVPANAPFELYDLRIRAQSASIDDVSKNSVRVLSQYKPAFTFIHLPDCHLPSVAWVGFYDDPNTIPEFRQILQEINLINPEFILQTGDLVDNGQNESQYQTAQELLLESRVPMFITGGNHDLWYNGHDFWYRYFGTDMNYSFLYGNTRFVGLEMYDIPSKTYTADQMSWLTGNLNTSIQAGETGRIIFTHYDESRQLTGDFVDQYAVDGIVYGHTHLNGEDFTGLRSASKLNTSYTMNDNGEYRLIEVQNGRIVSNPVLEFRHLRTNIAPANDGTSWKVQATITNQNDVDLEDLMVKLNLKDQGLFQVDGGTTLQQVAYSEGGQNKRVFYIHVDVPSNSSRTVTVTSSIAGYEPPMITNYNPKYDTTIYGGQTLRLQVQGSNIGTVVWRRNGTVISGASGGTYQYVYPLQSSLMDRYEAEVSNANTSIRDFQRWNVYVLPSPNKPFLNSSTRNFYKHDREVAISWTEPVAGSGVLEYGLVPGFYTGSITEQGTTNTVRFIPAEQGMGLGLYFCRIRSAGLSSDEFPIIIESSQAPTMISPVGNITQLSPVFEWEPVQGVPYYFLIMTDQKPVVTEDPETGDFSIEGANPIWAVLTSENSVPYGDPDPSGTFTSFPAPLNRGASYWWIVMNCYGNGPELVSTVQSGLSEFKINLPLSSLQPPQLVSPAANAVLEGSTLRFRWNAVSGAAGYNFYPFKIELEEGIEVIRPIWGNEITTTNTLLDYDAAHLLVKGNYQWKVSAIAADGAEVPSESRKFSYNAPFSTLNIKTLDNRGTQATSDDIALPRVTVSYDAVTGVDMGLPLSTDKNGNRSNLVFAPGTYMFKASKDGFSPYQETLTLAVGQTVNANFRMTPDPSTLTGKVTDNGSVPIHGASVSVQHSLHADIVRTTLTNQAGEFSVSLTPGPWLVTASKTGFQSNTPVSVSVQSGEVKALPSVIRLTINTAQVLGTVVNTSDQPVYGAKVVISRNENRQEKSTDSNGRFSFSVTGGTWTLTVTKNGFSPPQPRTVSVSEGQKLEITPNLVMAPSASMIIGSVSDGLHVIPRAAVEAVPASGAVISAVSDNYGQFNLSVPAGYYSLRAGKEGYSFEEPVEASLSAGESVSGVVLSLVLNDGSISGLVTSDGTTPLPDATVRVDGKTATTSSSGRYSMDISPGTYRVTASLTGYLSPDPKQVTLAPGQAVDGVNFILNPNASVIKGTVISSSGVAGARVIAVNGTTAETVSDNSGYYSINVQSGTYSVYAVKSGFRSDTLEVLIGQAQVLEGKNIALTRNIGRIQGTVKESGTNAALSGALVEIEDQDVSTTTKTNGTYQFEIVPSASGYTLNVSKQGYSTGKQATGVLNAGATVTKDFSLVRYTGSLSGTVRDQSQRPVASVKVTASVTGASYSTFSRADGTYVLGLPNTTQSYQVIASRTGYLFPAGTVSVTLSAGENRTNFNLTLNTYFSGLQGQVYNSSNGQFIAGATLQLLAASGTIGEVKSNDATGAYSFVNDLGQNFLPEGTYSMLVRKTGFSDTLITGIFMTGNQTTEVNVGMRKYAGVVAGVVSDGTNPVVEASVIINHAVTEEKFTKLTASDGSFRFDPVPAGEYTVTYSKSGYTSEKDTTVITPSVGLSLILIKNTGKFWGIIKDAATGQGLSSASISVSDAHGNEKRGYSNSTGVYEISQLPMLYPYTMTVTRSGYRSSVRTNVSSLKADTTNFGLQRIYGSVAGTVSLKGGGVIAGAVIRIKSGSSQYSGATSANGTFLVQSLPSGSYYVSADKGGYISDPSFREVNLSGGGNITGVNFILEEAVLKALNISGPSSIISGGSGVFTYSAVTADGRNMSISPLWSASPLEAVDSVSVNGVAYPRSDYIGSLWILLTDNYTGATDSLKVKVVINVSPGSAAVTLQDYQGASFQFLADPVVQPINFSVTNPDIPHSKKVMTQYRVIGKVYALQPSYQTLKRMMSITLPIPEDAPSGCVIGWWDRSLLKWKIVESTLNPLGKNAFKTMQTSSLTFQTELLAQYAVMAPSLPLGIQDMEMKPNPFSPLVAPLDISLMPTSQVSTRVFLTVKIYNMAGDLVRDLMIEESMPKDEVCHVLWDGKTDSGNEALNGRYILYFEAKDGGGTVKELKAVVLIK